jgi:glutamyl-tRNA synthetase
MVVRFAPSPTGPLHIGGVRTALYNYLLARKHGGRFILRIEDTDQNRYVPGAEAYIIEALTWCGIHFDEGPHIGGPHAPYRQSERKEIYQFYAHELVRRGAAYYAFDTEVELEEMRRRFEAAGMAAPSTIASPRSYMKNSLTLPPEEVQERLQKEPYVIRFLIPRDREVRFYDEIRGWVSVHTRELDDKVLLKSDGMPTYHLANVVDDHLMGVTHVIRGEEWLPSTHCMCSYMRRSGGKCPALRICLSYYGQMGAANSVSAMEINWAFPYSLYDGKTPFTGEMAEGYRERGFLPEGLVNYIALLGWHPASNEEIFTIEELIQAFSLDRVSKAGARFDYEKAKWINQQHLRRLSTAELFPMVRSLWEEKVGTPPPDKTLGVLIDLARERAQLIPEILEVVAFYYRRPFFPLPSTLEAKLASEVLEHAAEVHALFQNISPWEKETIETALKNWAKSLKLLIGKVLLTLRIALTGEEAGPAIYGILEVLGREEVISRWKLFEERYVLSGRV